MRDQKKLTDWILRIMKFLPFFLVLALVLVLGMHFREITVDKLLNYVPESPLLAAMVLISLYGVKSISVAFPLLLLYICAGALFSPLAAVAVNLAGLFVCISVPYCLGRLTGKEMMDRLFLKYRKMEALHRMETRNQWFFCYFLRVVNLLPGDIVSLLLGSMQVGYRSYVLGSLTGLLPTMLAATMMGQSITDPASPAFLISGGATVLISAVSAVVYWRSLRNA